VRGPEWVLCAAAESFLRWPGPEPLLYPKVTLSSEATKRVALKPQRPTQRRTMPTSHPNTHDFSKIALQHDAGDAFAALPVHILSTHVLRSRILPDGSDLARL